MHAISLHHHFFLCICHFECLYRCPDPIWFCTSDDDYYRPCPRRTTKNTGASWTICCPLRFIYLMLPGWEAPSLRGVILMTVAGVSWGIYSMQGKNDGNPIAVTSGNFMRAIPFAFLACIVYLTNLNATFSGVVLAFISGALTSGIGYVVWYDALRGLTVTQAASIQLLVPIIATIGGVIFLSEVISLRLILSSILILGGVGSSFVARSHQ